MTRKRHYDRFWNDENVCAESKITDLHHQREECFANELIFVESSEREENVLEVRSGEGFSDEI